MRSTIIQPIVTSPDALTIAGDGAHTANNLYGLTLAGIATDGVEIALPDGSTFTWQPTELVYRDAMGNFDYLVGSSPASLSFDGVVARFSRTFPSADDVFKAEDRRVKHWCVLHEKPRAPAEYLGSGLLFGVSGLVRGVPFPVGISLALSYGLLTLPQPIARDLAGAEVLGHYEVRDADGGQQLFVWFPAEFLTDAVFPLVIDPTVVVASAYSTSGNGGRKIVKLANGNIIVIAYRAATTTTYFYKSTDGGGTFTQMCTCSGSSAGAAITSLGNIVYLLFNDATKIYSLIVDTTTVADADQNASKVTVDTQASIYMNPSITNDGTDLHAAWASKNSTYPNSDNIRYSKYTIATTSWAARTQITADNTTGISNVFPCIVITSGNPVIAFEWTNATNYKIQCAYYTATWYASTIKDGTTYSHSMPCMVVESTNHIVCFYYGCDVTDTAKENIRCSESTDGGVTWGAETKLTSGNTYYQISPSAGITSSPLDDIYLYFEGRAAGTYNQVRRMIRTSGSWGAVSNLTSYTTGHASNVQAMAAVPGGILGYIWQNAENSRVDFDKETLNAAPNAPTGLIRIDFDAAGAATFSWTFSDDDPGDTQSAFKLRIREVGTGTWYYAKGDGTLWTTDAWIVSATSSFAMNAAVLTNEKQYEWYVNTKDAAGLEGTYSAQATVYTSTPPTATITYPAIDLDTHPASIITVQWSFGHVGSETQKKYQARLTTSADAELYTSGEVTDASATSKTMIYTLVTVTTYKLKVKVMSTKDLWSTEVVRTFVASFTPPATPTIIVTGVDASAYIRVAITNPAPAGAQPNVTNNDVYRRVSGTTAWTRIKVGVTENGTHDDYNIASGTTYEYKVRANGDNNTYADSDPGTESVALSGIWLHDVTDPAGTIEHFVDDGGARSAEKAHDAVLMQFAGRTRPVAEFGEGGQHRVTAQVMCRRSGTDYADLVSLFARKATLCYRDRTRRVFGTMLSQPVQDELFPLDPTVTVQIAETSFDEEV